jgi:hypothetical protein
LIAAIILQTQDVFCALARIARNMRIIALQSMLAAGSVLLRKRVHFRHAHAVIRQHFCGSCFRVVVLQADGCRPDCGIFAQ